MIKKNFFVFRCFPISLALVLWSLGIVACGDDESDDFLSAKDPEVLSSSSSVVAKSSSSIGNVSSSGTKYVCDIYTLEDALSCKCDESREGKLSYNYDSDVEVVCVLDTELNKWNWTVKDDKFSSSSRGESSSSRGNSGYSSSSSAPVSSSSYVCVDTVADIPSKLYDCDVYDCVPTGHLNPKVEYGELLDERDYKVYRTVEIGGRTWMAQNLAYACSYGEDFCRQYGSFYGGGSNPCPEGWEVPSMEDYDSLLIVYGSGLREMRARSCLWDPYDPKEKMDWSDSLGFSLLPSGLYDTYRGMNYVGCATYLWASTPTRFGYENHVTSSCKSFLASRDYSSNRFAIRCIKSREMEVLDVADCRKNISKCVFGTLEDERDGQTYRTVKYGWMEWMAQNLNYEYVPKDEKDRGESRCYNNSQDSCAKFGRLYNMGSLGVDSTGAFSQGICPAGWHIPSADEWALLRRSFKVSELVANLGGKSEVGFDIYRSGLGHENKDKPFYGYGESIAFWTSTINLRDEHRAVVVDGGLYLEEEEAYWNDYYAVRCLKDYEK